MTQPAETQPTHSLMPFLLAFLTPLLLTSGITDIALAHRAVTETIEAYKAAGQDQLVTVAHIVAFAFASLDNLRLSASPDQSVSMTLKLRGNASAMNRATQRSTSALENQRRDAGDQAEHRTLLASFEQVETEARAEPLPPQPSEPKPQQKPTQDRVTTWTHAMTDVAAEASRNLAKLPPAQRRTEIIRVAALGEAARAIRNGHIPPNKAALLTTTSLSAL